MREREIIQAMVRRPDTNPSASNNSYVALDHSLSLSESPFPELLNEGLHLTSVLGLGYTSESPGEHVQHTDAQKIKPESLKNFCKLS